MIQQIIASKFFPPNIGSTGVLRPRLFEILETGFKDDHKLTLVSAPAGYGKSTLVVGWLHKLSDSLHQEVDKGTKQPYAWLSVDQFDNDPGRFFSYWLACFRKFEGSIGQRFENLIALPQYPPPSQMMDEFISDLLFLKSKVIIVLDDFHVINNSYITECLEYFIDHQPKNVHLVVITRSDPPFPISRMRSRNQMTEIRSRDLKFTSLETEQFFKQTLKLPLNKDLIQILYQKTEGWPTGLQLAAQALQNIPDPETLVDNFRGSHRFVLDYLTEEVMRQQSQRIQIFLNKTSILDKFNSETCRFLTDFDDCQEILQYLEKANLFIISLDNESSWYRYHHLFADYLRAGLNKSESKELNKKAAVWFENNGSIFDAMHHALASNDAGFTAELMERVLEKGYTWSGGHLTTLLNWIDTIPQSILYARPYLCILAVPIVCAAVRFDQAEQLLHHAEVALVGQENSEGNRLHTLVIFYRGGIALMLGEIAKAIEYTKEAQRLLPADDFLFQSRVATNLSQAYELSGQLENAVTNYQKASELAFAAEAKYLVVNARCALAFAQRTMGKIQLAQETLTQTFEIITRDQIPPIGIVYIISGIIAYDQNEIKKAEELLKQGIDLARGGGLIDDLNWGLAYLAFVKLALGEKDDALAIMKQSLILIDSYRIPRISLLVSAFQAQHYLATDQIDKANIWAEEYLIIRNQESVEYIRDIEDLTLVRILLQKGNFSQIPRILEPLLESARNSKRNKTFIEGLILLAIFLWKQNKKDEAIETLQKAILLASPEGMFQIFIEIDGVSEIIPKLRASAPQFVERIMRNNTNPSQSGHITANLPDPLSEQEQNILNLLIQGKTNKEIAEELFITVGTVKWHLHNIFQKMGVNNRMHAIAMAREWGLKT